MNRLLVALTLLLGFVGGSSMTTAAEPVRPRLIKLPVNFGAAMENTPVVYHGRPLLVAQLSRRHEEQHRRVRHEHVPLHHATLRPARRSPDSARAIRSSTPSSRASEMNVFASEGTNHDWFQSIYRFSSDDLKTWKRELAIPQEGDEHLFNCSVCRDDQGYLMAYESNKPVGFCFKFARSSDLAKWEKIPGLVFTGEKNEYSACPVIRYFAPYYYVIYLHAAIPGHNGWVSFLARSKDLATWELSPDESDPRGRAGRGREQLRRRPVRVGRQYLSVLRHRRPADLGLGPRGPVPRADEGVLRGSGSPKESPWFGYPRRGSNPHEFTWQTCRKEGSRDGLRHRHRARNRPGVRPARRRRRAALRAQRLGAESAVEEILAMGRRAAAFQADFAKPDDVAGLADEAIAMLGGAGLPREQRRDHVQQAVSRRDARAVRGDVSRQRPVAVRADAASRPAHARTRRRRGVQLDVDPRRARGAGAFGLRGHQGRDHRPNPGAGGRIGPSGHPRQRDRARAACRSRIITR